MFSSNTTQVSDGGYQISRSLRFNSADSAYLARTPSSTSSQTTATFSAWVKRSRLGSAAENRMFAESTGSGAGLFWVIFTTSDQLQVLVNGSGTNITSTQVFRDPSAWYHIVAAVDTNQATSSDRIKLYVNGTQITSFTGTQTYYTLGQLVKFNVTSTTNYIGYNNSQAFDGYITEVNWIDGTQLTPSSFGETNAQTGVWQPKAYSGSYGTNGFYLNFSDNSNTTAATLGKDYSGNGNNWTPNNFSVTAGVGNDSLVDVPTPYGVDTGVGGTVRGNYCTLNPLNKSGGMTLSDGNLRQSMDSATGYSARGTIAVSSGKWYAEAFVQNKTTQTLIGVCDVTLGANQDPITSPAKAVGYYANTGDKYVNASSSSYGASYTTGDTIGIALDMDALTVTFYKNNTSQGSIALGTTDLNYTFFGADENYFNTQLQWNFGQRPFAYTAPSGFKALCTQNLPTPTIGATTATQAGKFFNPVTYTGNGTNGRAVTGVGFQPDLVWVKERSGVTNNVLNDVIRGGSRGLFSNNTEAEYYDPSSFVQSFNSDGFTVGSTGGVNGNGSTYVGWSWKANGSGSTNTAGSITSTVSANTTSGFSVVTYTGNGTAGATIGHGLGVAPRMIIIKSRSDVSGWAVYQADVGNTKYLRLDGTDAANTASTLWNNTSPTSSVFSVGTDGWVNTSARTYVAYCFAPVAGYSAFGSYTGNASADGPFVYCGFRPAYVMIKDTTNVGNQGNWVIKDKLRAANYNPQDGNLYANLSNAEDTASTVYIDLLSNGFKVRGNYNGINASGAPIIFIAFAESPFKYSLAR